MNYSSVQPLYLENTIFIPFVAPPYLNMSQANLIKSHIEHIFRNAAIPSRIFLGIYDCNDSISVAPELQKNVKIMKHMDMRFPFRESNARSIILSELSEDEKYNFLIPFNAKLTAYWDEILINNQKKEDDVHKDEFSIQTSMCKLSSILEHTTCDFLCLQEIKGARISLCTRKTTQSSEGSIPSLFWSPNYSFCHGFIFQEVPLLKNISDSMEITLNCIRLWTHGYRFVVPNSIVASVQQAYEPSQTVYKSPLSELGSIRSLREFEAYTGVSCRTSSATPRAYAGLSPKANVDECTCKYGSIELARLQLYE